MLALNAAGPPPQQAMAIALATLQRAAMTKISQVDVLRVVWRAQPVYVTALFAPSAALYTPASAGNRAPVQIAPQKAKACKSRLDVACRAKTSAEKEMVSPAAR